MADLDFQTIAALLPAEFGKVFVAYSGGVDSHVLLHLCASQPGLRSKIVAVYVDHGLQTMSSAWGDHCRGQATDLGVAFRLLQTDAHAAVGESPEAAARNARYRVLRELLAAGDLLLLAQHREDQMETLMLQLFRGAGPAGLAAMPSGCEFGKGRMLRPLLDVAKADILAYAQSQDLQWVEDPTNQSSDFDRNYLRNEIVPLLKQRWPAVDKTVARSARLCGDAAAMIEAWCAQALQAVYDPSDGSLNIASLPDMGAIQRNNLLRHWLRLRGLKPPSQAVLQTLVDQLVGGRDDADAVLIIQGCRIKKYRQKLYCIPQAQISLTIEPSIWPNDQVQIMFGNGCRLTKVLASEGIGKPLWDAATVEISPRRGGERLQLPGRVGHRCLKKLYQEAGVPPWERDIRPLIYLDGRLAAVAGLWVADWAWYHEAGACYALDWQMVKSV